MSRLIYSTTHCPAVNFLRGISSGGEIGPWHFVPWHFVRTPCHTRNSVLQIGKLRQSDLTHEQ